MILGHIKMSSVKETRRGYGRHRPCSSGRPRRLLGVSADHVGLVWVRVLADESNRGQRHRLTLRWGPYFKELEFDAPDDGPASFLHHKMSPDHVTLNASVTGVCRSAKIASINSPDNSGLTNVVVLLSFVSRVR